MPTSTRLLSGMLIPAIRAMPDLPLPLLVAGVLTDDQHGAVASDDLALFAHRLYRRSYLHGSFRLVPVVMALAAVPAAATTTRICPQRSRRSGPERDSRW